MWTLLLSVAIMTQPGVRRAPPSTSAPAVPLESRGVWIDKAQLLEGKDTLLGRIDRLKNAGFNTLYLAVQVRGYVMYADSRVLPQFPDARRKDPRLLDWLIPAVRKRGLRVEAWTEFGFYAYWTRDADQDTGRGPILDRHPELIAIDAEGRDHVYRKRLGYFYALCPTNPKSQDILIDLYAEMLDRYAFDGINLDRIRYPSESFCHCPFCRAKFRADTGIQWAVFVPGTPEQETLVRWRKEQLNRFVARLSGVLRTHAPGRRITAAVVPPEMIDGKGQDWPTWVREKHVDAVMPMLYAADISADLAWIRGRLGKSAAVFAGLDASRGASALADQIRQSRAQSLNGVTIWHARTVDPLLPSLGTEVFPAPAVSSLYSEDTDN